MRARQAVPAEFGHEWQQAVWQLALIVPTTLGRRRHLVAALPMRHSRRGISMRGQGAWDLAAVSETEGIAQRVPKTNGSTASSMCWY